MKIRSFEEAIDRAGDKLTKTRIEILQINLGKLCNLACTHCHVEAGPTKLKENMDGRTAEAVAAYMKKSGATTLDLTGGAPEMNPHFRYLVKEAGKLGMKVINRCNLTVLFLPGQEDLGAFLAAEKVEIVASLPCYLQENVDKQRGKGVFDDSIKALQLLNTLGYGNGQSGLVLNLVYNPVGPHLPPEQEELEKDYKQKLREDWDIVFDRLYTITNMPITRYAKYLRAKKEYDAYQELLADSFNPSTLAGLMCRNTLSVSWDGKLYDCDFNQALGMEMGSGTAGSIFDADPALLEGRLIATAEHCFGCTAGRGSSCQGALE